MKRLLSILVLILIIGSAYAPFYAAAKPVDSRTVDAATGESTISKWGGVASVKVKPSDAVTQVGGKLKTVSGIEVKVEEKADSVEYSWILASRPASNVFSLELTFTGCTYYYQPPLTAEEVKEGCTRPDNVVGSYAVYSEQRNGIYETGKICHIYRPLVIDATGKTTWGVMNIIDNTLTVIVDPKWLDRAIYPVVVDPEFGYHTIGASSMFLTLNTVEGSAYATPSSTTPIYAQSISIYGSSGLGTNFKGGIWVNTNGGALIKTGAAFTCPGGAANWFTSTFTSPQLLIASTTYMIGAISDNTWIFYYDNAGGTSHVDNTNNYAAPGVYDWDSTNGFRYSIFVTFSYGPSITSSVIALDDSINIYTMKKYYTFTTVITDGDGATDISSISVRGSQGASVRWMVNATSLDGVPAYTIAYGASTTDLDVAGCSFTEIGNNGTLVLSIRLQWDAINEANCELEVWASDVAGHTVGWTTVHTDYFSVINRLVTRDFTGNVTQTTINSPVEITGRVRYAITPTGYNASTSYPPDAQFTAVKIYDDEDTYAGQDTAIVNGFFNVTVTTPPSLGAVYYHAYLDLLPDYTDGDAVDADYVAISVIANFSIIETVNQGFAYWGTTFDSVKNVTTAFAGYFAQSATNLVSLVTSIMSVVFGASSTVIAWATRIASFLTYLGSFILGFFDGSGTYTTGLGDIWTLLGVVTWIDAVPIILFLVWADSVTNRHRKTGQGEIQIIVADIQIMMYFFGIVWDWSFTIFNSVVNLVMTFVGTVTG